MTGNPCLTFYSHKALLIYCKRSGIVPRTAWFTMAIARAAAPGIFVEHITEDKTMGVRLENGASRCKVLVSMTRDKADLRFNFEVTVYSWHPGPH